MINFYRISSVNDRHFQNLFNLYVLSFPKAERRTWAGLEHILSYEKQFCAYALVQDDHFVGLLNYWTFRNFFFIEHFAMVQNLRNHGLGTDVMTIFRAQCHLPLIFEVEPPTDEISERRISFYERQGYQVVPGLYAQPPYEGDADLVPMKLMTDDIRFCTENFSMIKDTLYKCVYNYQ